MSQYFVAHLSDVSFAAEEWLSEYAFQHGALGMSEVLPFSQPEGEEDVFTKIPDRRKIDIYFEKPPQKEFIELLHARYPEVRVDVNEEQTRDWLEEWKKGFKPFPLVDGHWVVPSWCEQPKEAKHAIWIDPGMAFGTGTHETTQLVAEALRELPNQESLLDVGTGTGILAILAKQLGYKKIAGTEIETDARRVALENFALNKAEDISLDERQVEDLKDKYDVVVANIIDGVLVRIQDALKARIKPGGWLIVSGIISEREKDFLAGFKIDKPWGQRAQKGDWVCYSVQL